MRRAALVLVVLLAAACGGGSSLSKGDYVSKAEAICKDANDKFKALARPSDPQTFQSFVEDTIQIAEDATRELKELEPPADDRAEIESKLIEPLEDQTAEGKKFAEKVRQAVSTKDQTELGKLLTNPPGGKQADLDWMKSYGFKDCVDAARTDRG